MSKKSEQKVARVLYMTVLCLAFLVLVSPFAIPVILAASIALAMFPLVLKLESKGMKRKPAAAISTILFTFIISIPISFFLVKGTITVTESLQKINFNEQLREQGMQGVVSDIRHDLVTFIHKNAERVNLGDFLTRKKVDSYLNTITTFLLNFFQGVVASLPVIFILLLVMILCLYSFLKNAHPVRLFIQKVFGFSNETMNDLVSIAMRDARAVYVSNVVTGSVQAFCVALGAAVLGIADFFLIFFITLVLAFIPVIGAAPVAFVCAGIAFFRGNNTHGFIMLGVGMFAGLIDNILRPWLASIGESHIPPITAFVCVLGGALWLGFPGLFIGLLVGTFAYDTLPVFWREIGRGENSYVEETSPES